MYRKVSKFGLAAVELEYSGHIAAHRGDSVDLEKVNAIIEQFATVHKKDVQFFLGLVLYYRQFSEDCPKISRP